MNSDNGIHETLLTRVIKKYENEGYKVYIEPKKPLLPFDLGSYRPDLMAVKSENDGYIIEIKSKATHVSIDQFRDIAEIIAQRQGWRFILITGDDISLGEKEQKSEKQLLSWEQIAARKETGERLLQLGESEGAFLTFWGILEAMMRKRAEQTGIPIERFPTSSLIKHLYSQGELSIPQFDKILELMGVRNQFVHGFQSLSLEKSVAELNLIASELFDDWNPK